MKDRKIAYYKAYKPSRHKIKTFPQLRIHLALLGIRPQEALDIINNSKRQYNVRYYWTMTRIAFYVNERRSEYLKKIEERLPIDGMELRKYKNKYSSRTLFKDLSFSKRSKFYQAMYRKLLKTSKKDRKKIAEKMSKNNDINESDTLNSNENAIQVSEDIAEAKEDISEAKEDVEEALYDILEMLNDLGIDLEGEEIAKITDDVGDEIKDKIGLTEGKLIANCTFANSQTRYYADDPEDGESFVAIDDVSNNNWWRYNRTEGLYFQINGVFQSPNIKGSSFYGGVGRAFHRNEYQWTLGLEQLIFKNIFQFYAEAFNRSITPDAWRLWDGENSLSTLFRRQDYLDWYNGQGYRTAGFIHIKNYFSIGAEYNHVLQSEMNNVLEGDKFREAYHVQEGDNIFLKTMLSVGYPVELSVRDEFQMYTTIIRTSSMENADINYSNDHLYFNILVPYAEKLNFNIKVMAGASNVRSLTWDTLGYHQNIFEIGGEGTLRGYDWKGLSSSHYQLTTLEAWFGSVGVFYDRAILFDSPGNVFNSKFLKDLSDNMSQDAKSAIGFILGRKNLRLSFAKQMTDNNNATMYLTFGTPLQYW